MSMNYGLIGSALLAALVGKGVQGMSRAKRVNRYNDQLNASLPQGYKVQGGNEGRFFFGDVDAQKTRLKGMYDQQLKQRAGDQYANRAGLQTGMDPEFAKTVYTSEYLPQKLAEQKRQREGMTGRQELNSLPAVMERLDYLNRGHQEAPQQQPLPYTQTPQTPQAPQGLETDPYANQNTPHQAAVSQEQLPELPDNFYMDPQTLRSVISSYTTTRGQDLTHERGMENIKLKQELQPYRLESLMQRNKWIAPKAQAYISRMRRSSGRAPTKTELAQKLLRDGDITQSEFKDFILGNKGDGLSRPAQSSGNVIDPVTGLPDLNNLNPDGEGVYESSAPHAQNRSYRFDF